MVISQCRPDALGDKLDWIIDQAQSIQDAPDQGENRRMPCGVFALDNRHILAMPRDNGDSRYPYGRDGMNFWVYASGYIHSNEGLFSHFMRAANGQEPNISFFAGLPRTTDSNAPDNFDPVPLLPVPNITNKQAAAFQRYTVLSSTAAYFITASQTLRFAVRIFVARNKDICFSITAENLGGEDQPLYLSSYFNPFLRHQIFEGSEDPWFKQINTLEHDGDTTNNGPPPPQGFLVRVNEDVDRTRSASNWGIFRRAFATGQPPQDSRYEQTTARQAYVGGTRGSLHTATALTHGTFGKSIPVCTFTDSAIAGDITHLTLKPGERTRLDIVFSFTNSDSRAKQLSTQPIDHVEVDSQLATLERDDHHRHSTLSVSIGQTEPGVLQPRVFDAFVEHLKRQVEFCSLIKGYVQLSPNSLIGIRDVCQAIEAMSSWRPQPARDKLIEALGFTAPDGRCFRQYSLPPGNGHAGRMDLRPFIDQGVWVISCVVSYLKLTGDFGFLDEPAGYHRIVDEDSGAAAPANETDSVLDHLFKIMRYLLDHRDHGHTGCIRALYGDWNDALDGLGVSMDPSQAYGTGVSVMATLQVYQNCLEMIDLLNTTDPKLHAKRIGAYQQDADAIRQGLQNFAIATNDQGEKRILHGWGDRRSYLVGGFNDPDDTARDGLTSNAFWVLSGMLEHDPELSQVILDAFDRLDGKYGLLTFNPAFPPDVRGVGRIGKLPPGTAENGAAYIHATAFAIMALFQMGQPKRAWEQLLKILPFTPGHDNLSHSPFVMPNSYGHNPELLIDGQNMNDWQTGSSNVVLKTLNRFVFGFEPTFDGLWIQPAGWAPFKNFTATANIRRCEVRLTSHTNAATDRAFTINGEPAESIFDPTMGIDKLWIPPQALTEKSLDILIES